MRKHTREQRRRPGRSRMVRHWIGRGGLGAALLALVALARPAAALPIEATAGTGPDVATVVLGFQDGADYVFQVDFDETVTTSGIDLLQVLQSEVATFSVTLVDYGFGLFVDGLAYAGHSDSGFGGGDLYWHYWTKESSTDAWLDSPVGAGDRTVHDGTWDGWRYGAGPPVPEPGTFVLVAGGLVLLARQRGRQRGRRRT